MCKRLLALMLTILLCFLVVGCDESEENNTQKDDVISSTDSSSEEESNIGSDNSETVSSQNINNQNIYVEPEIEETVITHVAIQGAVISRQDGSPVYSYKKKCESCGKVMPGSTTTSGTSGTSHSSFRCTDC